MTAGTRPSRRTERAAPLPVPLRVTAASCLIAAMMMSLVWLLAPCLQGCRNRREAAPYREARRGGQERRLLLAFAGSSSHCSHPETRRMASVSARSEKFRVEEDALGDVSVPAEHLWGAQTERSRQNFT